jgi:DNA-binding Xre family transcriptional regulator
MLALWLLRGTATLATIMDALTTGRVSCFQLRKKHIRNGATNGRDHNDNNTDMRDKKRHQYGEKHHMTHLTEKDVLAIRRSDKTTTELGGQHGVTRHAIGLIKRGKRWAHVGGPTKEHLHQKLFEKDVIAIKQSDKTPSDLAVEYNVDITTISKIQLGHLQGHVAPELNRQRLKKCDHVLTAKQVKKIKTALKDFRWGMCKELAEKYGVSSATISAIKAGRLWRNVHA